MPRHPGGRCFMTEELVWRALIFLAFNFPALETHAYNPLASVAGVFRETFAGRREPALSFEP